MAFTATELTKQIISLAGKYSPWNESFINNFEFQLPNTALSALHYPVITLVFYCFFIPSLEKERERERKKESIEKTRQSSFFFMKNRRPPPLKYILVVHNLLLSALSFTLFVVLALKLISFRERGYSYFAVYDQKGLLTFSYYLNHLLKYYEVKSAFAKPQFFCHSFEKNILFYFWLLDTIFLALKKKPINFLHAYHHPATLVLTWGQLVDNTGIQWIVILFRISFVLCLWGKNILHTIIFFKSKKKKKKCGHHIEILL
ncbi:hypothetical protein RFI_03334 [Reticulomyxa filosa]|uniref:Elongation of fatty acids protein n=1 Tax=Reticulomyxa filosa TaxID=46433 RepID=X6P5D8_RETFI|nr:hypothetical protein RFI_03334 [Reticulomyxa filosa]|eukprot:ETO33770.1 hypothetical protein RFI_03334 [Reticulomyxa filosa]